MKKKTKKKIDYKIVNIIASGKVPAKRLDLIRAARDHIQIEYEPEQFPGLIYKMPEIPSSALIFKNGKFICSGNKNEKDLAKAVKKVTKLIKPYILQPEEEKQPNRR